MGYIGAEFMAHTEGVDDRPLLTVKADLDVPRELSGSAAQVAVVSSIPPGLRIDPRRNLLKLTGLTQGVKSMPRHAEAL